VSAEGHSGAPLFGADQNPLRQGVFRAVAMARRAPDRRVVYAVQDADALGQIGATYRLEPHRGPYFSLSFDHPCTPKVSGITARRSELFGSRSFPPARLSICGPALPILARCRVDDVILGGLRAEIAWAVRCGAPEARAASLESFVGGLSGQPICAALEVIARHALADADIRWPENLTWTTVTALLGGDTPASTSLPGFEPSWLWSEEERPGAARVPRGELLPLEIAVRGYQLYATHLSYRDRVEAHAKAAGVEVAPPIEIRAPNLRFGEMDPLSFFDAGDTVRIKELRVWRDRWTEAWSARPTLLWAHLHGHVRATIERATIRGL
jgi:hypothetical protein